METQVTSDFQFLIKGYMEKLKIQLTPEEELLATFNSSLKDTSHCEKSGQHQPTFNSSLKDTNTVYKIYLSPLSLLSIPH